jgi:putative methionine-R-sulfoxide reductase with GAF domain
MDWATVLRWVGLYGVTDQEITAIGWSGPGAPAHPHFLVTQGLSGAAVATGRAVVVNDVTADPRYLTAFASTLSEAIVPVVDPGTDTLVGTLDVENAERDAFTDADRQALVGCAAALWGGCLLQRGHRSPVGNVTVGGEGGHPSGTGSTLGGPDGG